MSDPADIEDVERDYPEETDKHKLCIERLASHWRRETLVDDLHTKMDEMLENYCKVAY